MEGVVGENMVILQLPGAHNMGCIRLRIDSYSVVEDHVIRGNTIFSDIARDVNIVVI